MQPLDDALVGVAGECGGGVAELVGDDFYVDAGVEGEGGGAVAQVVQSDGWQPGLFDEAAEALGDRVGVPWSAVGADEEQSGVGPVLPGGEAPGGAAGLVGGEDGDGVGVEGDLAVAGVALGPFLVGLVAVGGDLVDDADLAFGEAALPIQP